MGTQRRGPAGAGEHLLSLSFCTKRVSLGVSDKTTPAHPLERCQLDRTEGLTRPCMSPPAMSFCREYHPIVRGDALLTRPSHKLLNMLFCL